MPTVTAMSAFPAGVLVLVVALPVFGTLWVRAKLQQVNSASLKQFDQAKKRPSHVGKPPFVLPKLPVPILNRL